MNNTGIKRNKAMRLASALMVLALLTVCAVSGTFAKYVTSADATDTARVAYWGFDTPASVTFTDLFKKTYTNVSGADDVIAPGTTGSGTFGFKFASNTAKSIAAPEVGYTFKVDTTGSSCDASITGNPNIKWKLDEGSWGTWADLLASIKALSGDASGTKSYNAGELPTEFNADTTHTVSWVWAYDENAADPTGLSNNDTGDTAMGNAATLANVTLKVTVSATQND